MLININDFFMYQTNFNFYKGNANKNIRLSFNDSKSDIECHIYESGLIVIRNKKLNNELIDIHAGNDVTLFNNKIRRYVDHILGIYFLLYTLFRQTGNNTEKLTNISSITQFISNNIDILPLRNPGHCSIKINKTDVLFKKFRTSYTEVLSAKSRMTYRRNTYLAEYFYTIRRYDLSIMHSQIEIEKDLAKRCKKYLRINPSRTTYEIWHEQGTKRKKHRGNYITKNITGKFGAKEVISHLYYHKEHIKTTKIFRLLMKTRTIRNYAAHNGGDFYNPKELILVNKLREYTNTIHSGLPLVGRKRISRGF